MGQMEAVITGIGVIAPNGIGKEKFWDALEQGSSAISQITSFDAGKFPVTLAAEIKDFCPEKILIGKSLRNLDRNALFLSAATKFAIDDAGIEISESNTDKIGLSTGTTFSHLWPVMEFDREVFKEGINFASPALFPSTVVNAASSQAAIFFNIQGFNATVSTGYTSGLEALKYSLGAINSGKAQIVFCGAVDALNFSLFFGLYKLGYMAGLKGPALSCPFDKRRNGPLLGEAAISLSIEDKQSAKARKANIFARVRSVASYFDAFQMGKVHPQGEGLEKAIKIALDESGVSPKDIDYISSSANSSEELDKIEVKVLKKIFGKSLEKIPVSSIKSMLGETFSTASALQIASCIGVMKRGVIPPTINYAQPDPECEIDCVPNQARKKKVKLALVTSFGPGGYNSACVLENLEDGKQEAGCQRRTSKR